MKQLYSFFCRLTKWVAYIGVAFIILVGCLIFLNVCLRYFFKSPIQGTLELAELGMGIIIFSGFAYTQAAHGHTGVDIVTCHLPEKARFALAAVTYLVSAFCGSMMSYGAFRQVGSLVKNRYMTASWHIPLAPFYGFAGVMLGLFALMLFLDMLLNICALFSKSSADLVKTHWAN